MALKAVATVAFAAILFASLSALCEGLKCYNCDYKISEKDHPCFDPKKHSEDKVGVITCSEKQTCVKEHDGSKVFWKRTCKITPPDNANMCGPSRCYCSKNLCNYQPGDDLSPPSSLSVQTIATKELCLLLAIIASFICRI